MRREPQFGEVSELADERDLGSRGVTRAGSSPAFPTSRGVPNAPPFVLAQVEGNS